MYRYCSPIKKRCKRKSSRESASPECKNLNDKPFSVDKCRIAGNFNGYNVIVENKNDIIDLCKMVNEFVNISTIHYDFEIKSYLFLSF